MPPDRATSEGQNEDSDDLADLHCDDPAAADAMRAIALARRHLEADWLPLIDGILTSRAMTEPIDGSAVRPMAWRSSPIDDDEMRPPSSAEVASDLIAAADDLVVSSGRPETAVLSNGLVVAVRPGLGDDQRARVELRVHAADGLGPADADADGPERPAGHRRGDRHVRLRRR
jgi:hypothetical protein